MWQRWNQTSHIFERSDNNGLNWVPLELNAAIISEGSIPDARLSGNVALKSQVNYFTQTQVIRNATPVIQFEDLNQTANQGVWRIADAGHLFFQTLNDNGSLAITPLLVSRQGDAYIYNNIYEKQRSQPIGHWQDIPFNAGNFYSTTGVWTVTAADIQYNRYALLGKTLLWSFYISWWTGTTVTGSPTGLRIVLPAGLVGAGSSCALPVAYNNASPSNIFVRVSSFIGANFIEFNRQDGAGFPNGGHGFIGMAMAEVA